METKLSSNTLMRMSISDLEHLETNDGETTFTEMIEILKRVHTSIKRMSINKATKKDYQRVKNFGYEFAGFDELWLPYRSKNYLKCLEVLKEDIKELEERTNRARLHWGIATGVKKEIMFRTMKVQRQ